MFILMVSRFYYKNITDSPIDVLIFGANIYYVTRRIILIKEIIIYILLWFVLYLIADMLFYKVLCICIDIYECFGIEKR